MHGIDRGLDRRRDLDVDRCQAGVELLHGSRADDVRGHERPRRHEGEREMNGVDAVLGREREVGVDRLLDARLLLSRPALEKGRARARRPGAALVLACEIALSERRVGQQTHVLAQRHLRQPDLEGSADQTVDVLDGGHARTAAALREVQEARHAPGRLVGEADVADLAFLDQPVERAERVFDRHRVVIGRQAGVGRAALAEQADAPVGPVQLVEVDLVRAQALQRPFQGVADVGLVEARALAVGVEPVRGATSADLGGEHESIAAAPRGKPAVDDAPGRALRLGLGRDRVHLGGIEEVDPDGDRAVHLGMALRLGVLLAEGHRAEADRGPDCRLGAFSKLQRRLTALDISLTLRPHRIERGLFTHIDDGFGSGRRSGSATDRP